jgi:ABC-type bacteriocin/lantibiotic exporter with double-glycine peptidase domain
MFSSLQTFGWVVRQSAEGPLRSLSSIFSDCSRFYQVENNMNSVERVVHYATEIEQEAPHHLPDQTPASPWPTEGCVEFKDVVFKYRPELPPVLKGLSMSIKAGEKIGIVGRCVFRQY